MINRDPGAPDGLAPLPPGMQSMTSDADLTATQRHATAVLEGSSRRGYLGRLLPFLGPAFIASIAYMDPGNFATNIQGGAQFGYSCSG